MWPLSSWRGVACLQQAGGEVLLVYQYFNSFYCSLVKNNIEKVVASQAEDEQAYWFYSMPTAGL